MNKRAHTRIPADVSRQAGRTETAADARDARDSLLSVSGLTVQYAGGLRALFSRKRSEDFRAVDGISFSINRGETLGLVGESGCGKSTTARAIVRLVPAAAGEITFDGFDVRSLDRNGLRNYRRQVGFVFQDPLASLDPRRTLAESVAAPLITHRVYRTAKERDARLVELFDMVGLSRKLLGRYPHECSGGQRQRAGIARALSCAPKLLICDEPLASLDVSVQAQVMNLLRHLQVELHFSYLFIGHDLATVRHMSDELAIMFRGRILERGPADEVFASPTHEYTKQLLAAVPLPDPKGERERRRIRTEARKRAMRTGETAPDVAEPAIDLERPQATI
jgi:peptide/nickel transport system ATP-binding protein/oligopeptide transport system ATP-binding protein